MKSSTAARYLARVALGAVAMASHASAFAQDAATRETRRSSSAMATNDASVGDIVVTARRVAESLSTTPVALTALSGDALEQRSVTKIEDIQRIAPAVFFQKAAFDSNSLTLSIRGQKQNDALLSVDPSVGIYIDGLYYPRTFGLAGALVDIARVEVLRGPQGTLYGRNTTGGAVSLYTVDPTDTLGGEISASYGKYDAWELKGVLNLPLTDTLSLRVVGNHSQHDPWGRDAVGKPNFDSNQDMARAKLRFDNGTVEATLIGTYLSSNDGNTGLRLFSVVPDGLLTIQAAAELAGTNFDSTNPTGAENFPVFAQIPNALAALNGCANDGKRYDTCSNSPHHASYEGEFVSLDISVPLSDSVKLRSITGYQHFDREAANDLDGSPYTYAPNRFFGNDRYLSQEFQLLGELERLDFVLGLYGGSESGTEGSNLLLAPNVIFAAGLPPGIGNNFLYDIRNRNIAAFGQLNYRLNDSTRITGGVRYSIEQRQQRNYNNSVIGGVFAYCVVPAASAFQVNPADPTTQGCGRKFSDTFKKPSWLLSVDHEFSDELFGYVKASYSFRSGGQNIRGSNVAASFAAFAPETVREYEAGLKINALDRHILLNLAAYYDDYKNVQRSVSELVPIPGTTGGFTTITRVSNAATARIWGMEADMTLRPTSRLTFTGAAGYTNAAFKKYFDTGPSGTSVDRSNQSFGVPEWTFNLNANYVLPTSVGDMTLSGDWYWQSKVDTNTSGNAVVINQPGYAIVNGRISLHVKSADLDVAFFGRNLFDKKYLSVSTDLSDSGFGLGYAVYGDPRTFGIQITKRFGGV